LVVVVTDDPSDHVVVYRSPSDVFVEVNTDVDCASAGATPTTALIKRPAINFISASHYVKIEASIVQRRN